MWGDQINFLNFLPLIHYQYTVRNERLIWELFCLYQFTFYEQGYFKILDRDWLKYCVNIELYRIVIHAWRLGINFNLFYVVTVYDL